MNMAISQAIEDMAHLKNAPKTISAKHSTAMSFEREIRAKGLAADEQIDAALRRVGRLPPLPAAAAS